MGKGLKPNGTYLKEFRSPDSSRIRGSRQSIFAYFSDIRLKLGEGMAVPCPYGLNDGLIGD